MSESKVWASGSLINSGWLNEVDALRFDADGAKYLSYTPAGTGTQARTVADRLGDTVSVFDFMTPAEITAVKTNTWTTEVPNVTAAVQAALDSGAGCIYLPSGTYKIGHTLTIPKNVSLRGDGTARSILDGSSAVYADLTAGQHIRTAEGTYSALPTLAVDPNKGDTTLTFTSAPTLVANDVILIYNPTDYSYSGFRDYYRAGEYLRVASVSGATVTLQGTLADSYTTGSVSVYLYANMTTCHLSDFMLIGLNDLANPVFGLNLISGLDSTVDNVKVTNCSYTSIGLQRCFNVSVTNCIATENFADSVSGGEYGMAISNSHIVKVLGGYYASYRHGITTGGNSGVGCVSNRYIVIDGTHVTGANAVQVIDFHGNTEYTIITNSTVDGGFSGGGDYLQFTNNIIRANTANGQVAMYMAEMRGLNVSIANNTIENRNSSTGDARGAFIDFGGNSSTITASTVRGGIIDITGNKFVFGITTSNLNASLIRIYNRGYVSSSPIAVNVSNNSLDMLNDVYCEGIQVYSVGDVTPWDSITISDNMLNHASIALIRGDTADKFVAKSVYLHNNRTSGSWAGGGCVYVDSVTDLISVKGNTIAGSFIYGILTIGKSDTLRCKRIHITGNTVLDGYISTTSSTSTNADIIAWNADVAIVQSNASGTLNQIITVASNSGFVEGEVITGSTSGATATVAYLRSTNQLAVKTSISGTFTASETITGSTSGATTTFTFVEYTTSYSNSFLNVTSLWKGQNANIRSLGDYSNNVTTTTVIT